MKNLIVKGVVFSLAIVLFAQSADAQRSNRRRTGNTNPSDTTGKGNVNQTNNNVTPPNYIPTNVPYVYDTGSVSSGGGKSLRQDGAHNRSGIKDRTPLDYEFLRADDALYTERVWRELDLREKINKVFQYEAEDDNGSQMFIDILLKAVNTGGITAFADERFTTPIDKAALDNLTAGKMDTVDQVDPVDPTLIVARVISKQTFEAKSVVKIRLKEEWVFDRESSRMFCRIIGICPVKTQYWPNGKEKGSTPMFWIYYPDLRPTFAKYEVYNPKNMGQSRMTWEELFESRMFSSYIIKSSIDNPANKNIRQYIQDPILRLLEGDNIKEKIFNFEQDLWSY